MPTPTKGARFGGSPSHQRLILANLAQALFENGRITTTEAKARRLRPYAEHLISKARIDTVANRRQVVKVIRDQDVLHTLFTEIGPAMATRPGGYTRITKIGPRKGDNAPMAVIEIVESKDFPAQNQTPKKQSTQTATAPKAEVTPGEGPQAQPEETTASPHGDPLEDAAEAVDTPEADTGEAESTDAADAEPADETVEEADVEQAADDVAEAVENEAAGADTDADQK